LPLVRTLTSGDATGMRETRGPRTAFCCTTLGYRAAHSVNASSEAPVVATHTCRRKRVSPWKVYSRSWTRLQLNMASYQVRGLRSEELEAWLEFVYGVFKDAKGTAAPPRSYFLRHVENDPGAVERLSEDILVAVGEQDKFIGSLRIFRRRVYLKGSAVSAAGIGEVSVASAYRRQGIASRLLEEASTRMRAAGFALSFLHTSSSESLYRSLGWISVPQKFVRVVREVAHSHRDHIETLALGSEVEIQRCSEAYAEFASRFDGCIVRDDPAYWQRWVRAESGDTEWNDANLTPFRLQTRTKEAYAILQKREDAIHVREFVVRLCGLKRAGLYLDAFLARAVSPDVRQVCAVLAAPLLPLIGGSSVVLETTEDHGYMYRALLEQDAGQQALPEVDRHVFWATDAF